MNRQQIILLVISISAVILIFQLPMVVVENEPVSEVSIPHEVSISDEDRVAFSSLTDLLRKSENTKNSVNFADSLARLSLKYQLVDSAVYFASIILEEDSSESGRYKAAHIYYRAFQVVDSRAQVEVLAGKARAIFEELLVADPENSSLKNKLAMTLIATDTPMAGVQLLREVLEADPENREATFNLGVLAIRSGQYDLAIERFSQLISLNSDDDEAIFYLGVAYVESGKNQDAKKTFERLIDQEDADPALKATASTYLKDL